MADIELASVDVRAAADRMAEAGGAVRAAGHPRDVARVADALPGSLSEGAARRLHDVWSREATSWAGAAQAQSDRMTASAAATAANDGAVSASMQRLASRLGPVPR